MKGVWFHPSVIDSVYPLESEAILAIDILLSGFDFLNHNRPAPIKPGRGKRILALTAGVAFVTKDFILRIICGPMAPLDRIPA